MSMCTIPDIRPKIEIPIEQTIKLLLASIVLEDIPNPYFLKYIEYIGK